MRFWSMFLNRIRLFKKKKHLYKIKKSKQVIFKIKKIAKSSNGYAKAIMYLRKIDPYVFEELILTVVEQNNIKITRNTKYSGDGGLDGKFKLNNQVILIQAKRYKNYINLQHVTTFITLVNKKNHLGLFIHTGKTGKNTKNIVNGCKNVTILSGSKLIDFIIGNINIKDIQNFSQK